MPVLAGTDMTLFFRFLTAIVLALGIQAASIQTASAHAAILETMPADGARLDVSPESIVILFNEPVQLLFLRVVDATGRALVPADSIISGGERYEAPLPKLPSGVYVASYRVVSIDGHPIGGSILFNIGAATASAGAVPVVDNSVETFWTTASSLLRFLNYALIVLVVGGAVFRALVVPADSPIDGRLRRYIAGAAVAALVSLTLSVGVEGAFFSLAPLDEFLTAPSWRLGLSGPAGASSTVSGIGLLLVLAALCVPHGLGVALGLLGALIADVGFAFTGHAAAAAPHLLSGPAVVVHALAAGVWIGGLWPLVVALRHLELPVAAAVTQRFSTVAIAAVALLFVAGTVLSVLQLENVEALWQTQYGTILAGKLVAVVVLLGLASLNKWRLTPGLQARRQSAASSLRRSIGAEIGIAVAVLLATATLGVTPPPRALAEQALHHQMMESSANMDVAQGYQTSIAADGYMAIVDVVPARAGTNAIDVQITRGADNTPFDPLEMRLELAQESAGIEPLSRMMERVGVGKYRLAGAALPFAGTWSVRVDAVINDFKKTVFESEVAMQTRFSVTSIKRGGELFAEHCTSCHGKEGRGDGPAAAGLPLPPADLTADHLYDHSPHDLFMWISNGRGKGAMPGFSAAIDEEGRWSVIDYLHAHSKGITAQTATPRPSPAPDLGVTCPDDGAVWLSDLRGRMIHVVFADATSGARLAALAEMKSTLRAAGALSLVVTANPATVPPALCVTTAPETALAYAVASGVQAAVPGMEMLVDSAGWLRERWTADPRAASDSGTLLARIRTVRAKPVAMDHSGH